jgi:DHA1 family florfenicol/chloramphenicol resistance protein-like MFS transporter
MALLLCGAVFLGLGQALGSPSFGSFILPMWIMAVGIVLTVSVTANGALAKFDDIAGSAVAFYFCIQSLLVGIAGTLAVTMLDGDSAWPLIGYSTAMAVLVLIGLVLLGSREPAPDVPVDVNGRSLTEANRAEIRPEGAVHIAHDIALRAEDDFLLRSAVS